VTPSVTWQADDGRYCREFTGTATVGGEPRQVYGRACRQPDGAWEIVS
jgi:surface antigen